MRCATRLLMCSLLLAACGDAGGDSGTENSPPDIVDAARGGSPVPPREDAFVLADLRVTDQGAPPDALAPPEDAAPTPDAEPDAMMPVPPAPAAGGLAAGAAPLRSARYRLYAVVGPAAAVGAPLTSSLFRLESGPTQWLAPVPESPR
jgi:hypothetical protein